MLKLLLGGLLGILIASLFRNSFAVILLHSLSSSLFRRTEFFDSQDLLLNMNFDSSWGNLGYWYDGIETYSQACEALALQLGQHCHLQRGDSILDIGFGHGDQILLWRNHFGAASIRGFNISKTQTVHALEKTRGVDGLSLQQGSYHLLSPQDSFDKVFALDCAYHFPCRQDFLERAYDHLKKSGSVGLVDLFVDLKNASFSHKLLIYAMATASKIPLKNLWAGDHYINKMKATGFEDIRVTDISEKVFFPFQNFVHHHFRAFKPFVKKELWFKYKVSAWVLSKLYSSHCIKLVIVSGAK